MELGNAIFGHSRGEWKMPRGEGFEEELGRLFSAAEPARDTSWGDYGIEYDGPVWSAHLYCWCEKEDCPQCGIGEQANFTHKPSGLEIRWYKYPLRDAYASRELTLREFSEIVDECIESLSA